MRNLLLYCLFISIAVLSCKDESSNPKNENVQTKYDINSLEYKYASAFCECFESVDLKQPQTQMEAVKCLMKHVDPKGNVTTNDEKVKEILLEICPSTYNKTKDWEDK